MRERTAAALLCALTAVLALPYALAGTNFILDDWFAVRNAMFQGAFAAGGHNQLLARPGAWLTYGLTFGLIGPHPLPIYLLQTAVNAAVAVALFVALRRFVPTTPAFAAAAVWVVLPIHTSLDNWASALNISLALLALLVGIAVLGRTRGNWAAAVCFAVAALWYEATMPLAAVMTLAEPLLHRRSPRGRDDVALPAVSLAVCGLWIVTHWHPDKHISGWAHLGQFMPAHFGWGVVWWPPFDKVVLLLAMVVAGLTVMVLGVLPFLRYFYAPLGAGDRVNVVSSVGAAMAWTGLGWMALKFWRVGACVLGVALASGAVATNVHRDELYARAGHDVQHTLTALDRAIPHPDGPIALGPTALLRENIGGLLDESNVDGALQVHRKRQDVRGYVAQNRAEWLRAPANRRFDQRR